MRSVCTRPECSLPVAARGLCSKHYYTARLAGVLPPPLRGGWTEVPKTCSVEGCHRFTKGHGLCQTHLVRKKKGARLDTPLRKYDGTGWVCAHTGYRHVFLPDHPNATASNGSVPEHRLVMSRLLGRPLREDENVHHKNGDRLDNRVANLELWSTSQPCGQRVEDKADWAVEILRRYRPEALNGPIDQ